MTGGFFAKKRRCKKVSQWLGSCSTVLREALVEYILLAMSITEHFGKNCFFSVKNAYYARHHGKFTEKPLCQHLIPRSFSVR